MSFPSLKGRNDEKKRIEKANLLYNVQHKVATFNDNATLIFPILKHDVLSTIMFVEVMSAAVATEKDVGEWFNNLCVYEEDNL